MTTTFATYEHSTIGFPKVQLKFSFTPKDGYMGFYVTVKDVIKHDWPVSSTNYAHPTIPRYAEIEIERFDKWVRQTYSKDISVQG